MKSTIELRFGAFAAIWALVGSYTILTVLEPNSPPQLYYSQVAALAAALWVILGPTSLTRFLIFVVAHLIAKIIELPKLNNHGMVIFFADLSLILAYVSCWFRGGRQRVSCEAYYTTFAPSLRVILLVLYFWAAFQKVNTGFLEPEISCAVALLRESAEKVILGVELSFLPTGLWVQYSAIYGTILVEAGLAVLFAIPRTRLIAASIAFPFHLFLGLSYPAFASMMYAMFSLFLPPAFWVALAGSWQKSWLRNRALRLQSPGGWARVRGWLDKSLPALLVFALMLNRKTPLMASWGDLRYDLLFVMVFVLAVIFFTVLLKHRPRAGSDPIGIVPRPLLCVIPLLVFATGLMPHLGVRATLAFSMYSNLRVEGDDSNHLVLPVSMQISDNLNDLVEIVDSSDRTLRGLSVPSWNGTWSNDAFETFILGSARLRGQMPAPSWQLPFETLTHYVYLQSQRTDKPLVLVYERAGQRIVVPNAFEDPVLGGESTGLWRRAFKTRAVPDIPQGICMW